MQHARRNGYALGYFESWSIESLCGVIDAAEQTRSPVIIGFNGEFLSHCNRVETERLSLYGALGRAAAETAGVPCGLIFNECAQDEWTRGAVNAGFNLVMPADPDATHDDYLSRVRAITDYAHTFDVAVEAEIGKLPFSACHIDERESSLTSPEDAAAFVAQTGVDILAVSIGNVHVALNGCYMLDLERLAAIHAATNVPLALHGGTGIDADHLRKTFALGVTKVNYGTYIKQRYLAALRHALEVEEINPHVLLGIGSEVDLMVVGRRAVREAVLERMPLLNSAGKA